MPMTVSDTLDIAAPASLVWKITTDVERWPEWTPTVKSVHLPNGPLQLGSIAVIKQPMQPQSNWTVVEYEPERRFVWATSRPGLRLEGVHDLTATVAGTQNLLQVHATGTLAFLLWPVLRIVMRKALRDENAGLKRRCEQEVRISQSTP